MQRFHAKRLAKLATYMKTVTPDEFYIGAWIDGQEALDRETVEEAGLVQGAEVTRKKINVCGTTACLLGHAGTMPEFRKRGLKLKVSFVSFSGYNHETGDEDRALCSISGQVELRDEVTGRLITRTSMTAGQRFFGLTDTETTDLFSDEGYPVNDDDVKPHHTVTLIKKILRKNGYSDIAATI